MKTSILAGIRNFREADERLATSGQPSEAQLEAVAALGFQTVINLALHNDARYSLRDETASVRALGMDYIHIPVQFANPTEADLLAFMRAMDAQHDRKLLVHCAANYRVTAFLGLYRVIRQHWSHDQAFALMRTVWTVDPTWAAFIEAMLAKHRAQGP